MRISVYPFARTLLLLIILIVGKSTFAQSDADNFAEGRVALDKFKDCPTALKALNSVSEDGRKDPMWVYYMARTFECLTNYTQAIRYYTNYDTLMPGQPSILEKLAELRYMARKTAEAEVLKKKKDQAESEQKAILEQKKSEKAAERAKLQDQLDQARLRLKSITKTIEQKESRVEKLKQDFPDSVTAQRLQTRADAMYQQTGDMNAVMQWHEKECQKALAKLFDPLIGEIDKLKEQEDSLSEGEIQKIQEQIRALASE